MKKRTNNISEGISIVFKSSVLALVIASVVVLFSDDSNMFGGYWWSMFIIATIGLTIGAYSKQKDIFLGEWWKK